MQAVAGHLTQRIGHYSPQSLSNILWAFATQETHPGTPALDAAALLVCKCLQVSTSACCTCYPYSIIGNQACAAYHQSVLAARESGSRVLH